MIKITDHTKSGGSIDWVSYRKAQRESGETCSRCGCYVVFPKDGPGECVECRLLGRAAEVIHPSLVRCPRCGHIWEATSGDQRHLFDDGEHSVMCEECEYDFEISTEVSYSFLSPKRLTANDAS